MSLVHADSSVMYVGDTLGVFSTDIFSTSFNQNYTYLYAWNNSGVCVVTGFRLRSGLGGTGHIDLGIYGRNGSLLMHTGPSTFAQSSILTINLATPVYLAPGGIWLAFWIDNGNDNFYQFAPSSTYGLTRDTNGGPGDAGGLQATLASIGGGNGTQPVSVQIAPFYALVQGGVA